MSSFVVFILG